MRGSKKGQLLPGHILRNLTSIRRTQKGNLLLELKAGEVKSLSDITAAKKEQGFSVIECNNLDGVTTKPEIYAAFQSPLGLQSVSKPNVLRLKKAYGHKQTVSITLQKGDCSRRYTS